jgi:hypothetical protein
MIEVDKLGINTNMFAGTLTRESQSQMNIFLTRFTGEPGAELMSGIQDGRFAPYAVPQDLLDRTNQYFNNAVASTFNLPPDLHMTRFWAGQEANANQVHFTVAKNFPSLGRLLELNSELTTVTGDVTDTLEVMAGHPGTKYAYEMRRRLLLAMTSTAIEADNMQIDISRELRKIEGVMQNYVFAAPDGETIPHVLYAEHDKQTNQVIATDARGIMPDVTNIVTKRHTFNTRIVPGYGKIYYAARGKGPDSSITKALDRAYKNGGKINPSEDVRDRYGLVMVGLENDSPESLVKLVGAALNEHYKPVDPEKTEEDNHTNGDYQGKIKMARTLFFFDGQDHQVPFEVMAFKPEDYIDTQLYIGTRKKNGEYSGFGRPLFEVVRLLATLDLGYPRVNQGGFFRFDLQKAIIQRQGELVPGMRREGLIQRFAA